MSKESLKPFGAIFNKCIVDNKIISNKLNSLII